MDEQRNSMEEKILACAKELFLKNGYDGTSTTQIAKLAGCNQALIHYYFRSKEKLLETIICKFKIEVQFSGRGKDKI